MRSLLPAQSPPLPNEHGAWGILLGAFFSVTAVTHTLLVSQLLFLSAVILFYLSRQPFLLIMKSRVMVKGKYLPEWTRWFFILAALGWIFLSAAVYTSGYPMLIMWSMILPFFSLLEIGFIRKRKQRGFIAQLMGTLGLTSIAALSMLLFYQNITTTVMYVWIINILFFTSGIIFVRYQIAAMKKREANRKEIKTYKAAMICYHFGLLIILFLIALTFGKFFGLLIAFTPAIVQSAISISGKFRFSSLKTVGWLEIAQTVCFVILLSIFI